MTSTPSRLNQTGFATRFSRLVVAHKGWVILISLLFFLAGASGIPKAGFNASYRVFFGKDNPQLKAFDAFQEIYSKDDNVSIVVYHPEKPVFSNEVLQTVRVLTDALWKTDYVTRVDSVTNFQHTEVAADDLIVEDLVSTLPLTEEELLRKEDIALFEPLLAGFLLSRDGKVTQINARVLFPPLEENPNVAKEIFFKVKELIASEKEKNPGMIYRISGIVAINTAFSMTPEEEMGTMMPIMLGLIIVFLALLLRSVTGVLFPLFMVFLSILFTLGISGHLGIRLTPVSATFFQILLAVAIAYSVHIMVSFVRLIKKGKDKQDAVSEALEKNLTPILLTAVTTAIGFLSMTLNEVPPVQHLGIFVGIGVLFTFVVSVTLLPALLLICPCRIRVPPPGSETESRPEWTDRLGSFVIRHNTPLFYGLLGLALFSALFIMRLELNDNPVQYFKEGTWYRETAEFVNQNLTGVGYTDFSLESGEPNGITNPEYLKKVESFVGFLETFPEIVHVNSIVPTMKRLNRNLHQDDPSFYRLPDNQELAAQYLLLYTLSLPFGLDLTNQINVDYSSTRVTATTKKIPAKRHREILSAIESWVKTNHPDLRADGTGSWVMFTFLADRVVRGMLKSLILALFLITTVCIMTFGSFRLGLLSLIPNALPVLLTFGVWGMMGDHIDFAVSIVATAALGIIVDDTVHLLIRYQRGKNSGMEQGEAFRFALHDVGHALLYTSIILIVGFGLFALSGFRINSSMGVMISVSIGLALLYDFLFLPGVILRFDRKNGGVSPSAGETTLTP